jgi:Flp pilus assembly pilin Flp
MSIVAILQRILPAIRRGSHDGQLRRLFVEENGQDVVEYALLTAFIGFAGATAWDAMRTSLGTAYTNFSASVWNLWDPADPVGGGS